MRRTADRRNGGEVSVLDFSTMSLWLSATVFVILSKSNERYNPRFDRAVYRQRNRIERLINRLKRSRRIAT